MCAVLDFAQAEKVGELEAWCRDQAETVLSVHDIETDEASTLRVAWAIAARLQRASLTLAALARGEPEAGSATASTSRTAAQPWADAPRRRGAGARRRASTRAAPIRALAPIGRASSSAHWVT